MVNVTVTVTIPADLAPPPQYPAPIASAGANVGVKNSTILSREMVTFDQYLDFLTWHGGEDIGFVLIGRKEGFTLTQIGNPTTTPAACSWASIMVVATISDPCPR